MMARRAHASLMLTVAGLSFAVASPVAAASTPTFSVEIPAQPLAEALLDLSRRTGAVVIAPAPLMRGRRAPAVSGRMTLAEALARLLAGADLDFAIGADGVATIGPRAVAMMRPRENKLATPPPMPADDTPIVLASVNVVAADNADPALALKRVTPSPIDLLLYEDLRRSDGLADAVTRLPGVAATQDGGEARQVSIRGVGSRFTRVRINGMEALATYGGANAGGGTNRGRAFDYNVFAADLFRQIRLQKTASADVDEGSLGPTIDLQTRSAFDTRDKSATLTVEGAYNSRSELASPRITAMASRRLLGDRLGLLVSAAYSERAVLDVGSNAGQWQTGNAASPGFGSTTTSIGLTDLNAALHPRIPRLEMFRVDQRRLGLTAAADWRPSDRTRVSLNMLYSELGSKRDEYLLETFTLRTSGACASPPDPACGLNATKVTDAVITSPRAGLPVLIAGTFDNVDIKSEARRDELKTIFRQTTLLATQRFGRDLTASLLLGFSRSDFGNPVQDTVHLDQYDVSGFRYDFRSRAHPVITFGDAALQDPSAWSLAEIRSDPNWVDNSFKTVSFDADWSPGLVDVRLGLTHKDYSTEGVTLSRSLGTIANINGDIPSAFAAIPVARYIRLIGADTFFTASGGPTQWLAPDVTKAMNLFRALCQGGCDAFNLGPEPVSGLNYGIEERDNSAYLQLALPRSATRRVWGDLGLRYVRTEQTSRGFDLVSAGGSGVPARVSETRTYEDWLPSLNLVFEPTDALVLRLAAAKVMARPELRSLRPGVSIGTAGLKSVSAGNPNISPSRARTLDAAVEWYFAPSAVLSVAAFHKTITSTVQSRVTGPDVFSANPFGLPDSLAVQACARAIGCDPNLPIWLFLTPTDSGRGQLNGLEISLQTPLSLASARLKAWSLQAALAYSRSRILYWTKDGEMRSVNDALGAPRVVANLSLVYRRDRLEARVTSAYRDRYLSAIPAPTGGDVDGVNAVATLDVSARYAFSRHLAATFEGSNLTDAYQRQFSDSSELPNYQHRLGREYRLGLSWRH